jgi:predicted nucleic acid-binding protein
VRLLDTNVVVYARSVSSPFKQWAEEQIANAVSTEGAALSAVSLAELCAEPGIDFSAVAGAVTSFGVQLLDVPAAVAERCGQAYGSYRQARAKASGKNAPAMPLPDFFIGAHAELLDLELVTNDPDRIRTYFPKVKLVTP